MSLVDWITSDFTPLTFTLMTAGSSTGLLPFTRAPPIVHRRRERYGWLTTNGRTDVREIFMQELAQVGDDLQRMSRLVIDAIENASTALQTADLQLAESVIRADEEIDEIERSLDEQCISLIARQLESMGETELASSVVGELVMKQLKSLDDVAYVRYASVYRDFREAGEFATFLEGEGLADTEDER